MGERSQAPPPPLLLPKFSNPERNSHNMATLKINVLGKTLHHALTSALLFGTGDDLTRGVCVCVEDEGTYLMGTDRKAAIMVTLDTDQTTAIELDEGEQDQERYLIWLDKLTVDGLVRFSAQSKNNYLALVVSGDSLHVKDYYTSQTFWIDPEASALQVFKLLPRTISNYVEQSGWHDARLVLNNLKALGSLKRHPTDTSKKHYDVGVRIVKSTRETATPAFVFSAGYSDREEAWATGVMMGIR